MTPCSEENNKKRIWGKSLRRFKSSFPNPAPTLYAVPLSLYMGGYMGQRDTYARRIKSVVLG